MNELTNNSIIQIYIFIFIIYLYVWVLSLLFFVCLYIRGCWKFRIIGFFKEGCSGRKGL